MLAIQGVEEGKFFFVSKLKIDPTNARLGCRERSHHVIEPLNYHISGTYITRGVVESLSVVVGGWTVVS